MIGTRARKILIGAVIALVIYTVAGFFVLPPLIKKIAAQKLTEALHRQTAIRDLHLNPYNLSLTVKGFSLKERSGPGVFVSFDELYLNIGVLSIFKGGPIIKEVRLERPVINIVRYNDLSYNFSDLLPKPEKKESSKFSINNIQIRNGSIDFEDMPKGEKHQIRDVVITVPFISNMAQYVHVFVQPALFARSNGTIFQLHGKSKPFSDSLETNIDLDLADLDIPHYLSYVPLPMNYKVTSGRVGVKLNVSYVQYKDKKPSLNMRGAVKFKDIAIQDLKKNPMVTLSLLDLGIALSDLMSGKVHLSKVALTALSLDVQRDKTGRINLAALVPETPKTEAKSEKKEGKATFSLDIDELQLAQARISAADFRPRAPFSALIYPIDLTMRNFSTSENRTASYVLSFKTDAEEGFKTEGRFSLHPLALTGTVEITGIPIKRYSPYYAQSILFDVKDGIFQASTKYAYAESEGKDEARLSDLSVSVANLRLRKRDDQKDFLNIPLLSCKGASLDLFKQELTVAEIFSRDGKLAVERLENGALSLSTLIPASKKAERPLSPPRRSLQSRGL